MYNYLKKSMMLGLVVDLIVGLLVGAPLLHDSVAPFVIVGLAAVVALRYLPGLQKDFQRARAIADYYY